MTKAKQLRITEFPYKEYDSYGNEIYYENSNGNWYKCEYDSNNNEIYYEDSDYFGFFKYYEGDEFIKIIKEGYKEYYLAYKRNIKLNTLLND